jgi:hypothetical protein
MASGDVGEEQPVENTAKRTIKTHLQNILLFALLAKGFFDRTPLLLIPSITLGLSYYGSFSQKRSQ